MKYCVTRQELLAIVFRVRKFRAYLAGAWFTVQMDHSALRWLLDTKDPEGQMAQWIQEHGTYDFRVIHRLGKKLANADGMSCGPMQEVCIGPSIGNTEGGDGDCCGQPGRSCRITGEMTGGGSTA